jgi:hypothetical protein
MKGQKAVMIPYLVKMHFKCLGLNIVGGEKILINIHIKSVLLRAICMMERKN